MKKIHSAIKLLRPHQWLKNAFCFLPLFFDGKLFNTEYLLPCVVACVSFCLAASGIYCFNDIYDVEKDRLHPKKCKRPIASGDISVSVGYGIMAVAWASSLAILAPAMLFFLQGDMLKVMACVVFYGAMNIAYCTSLKNMAIVDIIVIALGFVIRILVGGFATGVWMSHWIILMTFLLAMFLAFAKRRDDVVTYEESGIQLRRNVNRYNLAFMNQAIGLIASITIVCYIMYTVSPDVTSRYGGNVYLTSVFVLAGILRYLQITIVDVKSGSPTKVLMHDRFIQLTIVGWVLTFALLLYL